MLFKKIIVCISFLICVVGFPNKACPDVLQSNGKITDLVYLSDIVSWNTNYDIVTGICDQYHLIYEKNGMYDTRMRIYSNNNYNTTYILFRPTQQTQNGLDIHNNRYLSPCTIIFNGCQGLVHNRFQIAFESLVSEFTWEILKNSNIYIGGHSLGGSLTLFMGVYLYYNYNILYISMIGLGSPFIGDEIFHSNYIEPLKSNFIDPKNKNHWNFTWQIETINEFNPTEFDNTVEDYNVDQAPFIYIDYKQICGVIIPRLVDSYGMHDIKNYQLFFNGNAC